MRWSDLPIRRQLQVIVLVSSGLAVLAAGAGFVAYQHAAARRDHAAWLSITADIVGDQCSAALEFEQHGRAGEILAALRAEPQILTASVHRADGSLFASHVRAGADPALLPREPGPVGTRLEGGTLAVARPIVSDGDRIGTIHLRSDMSALGRILRIQLAVVAFLVLVAVAATTLLAARMSRGLTRRIQALAEAARAVSANRDYSIRVEGGDGGGELGQLMDDFNGMLAEVQVRDEALARARDDLERRVEERTHQLSEEVAERKAAEASVQELNAELRGRNAELVSVNAELEAFSYSVSHDLRSPLRAIGGFSRMLVEDLGASLDPRAQRYLGVITRNTEKMGQLIDDLLAFSRMSRSPMSLARVDVAALVRDVEAEVREQSPGRNVVVELGELPPARANASMLRQVFLNLLANAFKYTRPLARAHVRVGSRIENGEVVYFVSDDGVGFDMRHAGKLFGIFQRLHAQDEFEGTGVGLALVHRIVERHGGRVWAEAAPGKGATFSFTLSPSPLAPEPGGALSGARPASRDGSP